MAGIDTSETWPTGTGRTTSVFSMLRATAPRILKSGCAPPQICTVEHRTLPLAQKQSTLTCSLSRTHSCSMVSKKSIGKEPFEFGVPSQQVVTSTKDGTTWTEPKECFLMNNDFWHPTEFNGRHYVACDTVGHTAHSTQNSVNPLTSEDGERCK